MTTTLDVVREICLGLPETEEIISHGFPHYKVRDKGFATYSLNHHGDGKVALLLNASLETQQMLVESAPKHFFIPPYIGPRGWIGVELNQGLSWNRISQLTVEAFVRSAPASLSKSLSAIIVKPPSEKMSPEDINPLESPKNQGILKKLRKICLGLPESTEAAQFGHPAFKAGKKTFATVSDHDKRTELQIWVGPEQQLSLTSFDNRFRIPPYVGHNGWINLDLSGKQNWPQIEDLLLLSYKHFALKRMLKELQDY
ncbi:MAG: MmcQ/YjbR family DNA-binding protein [bacterium]|nr:MmcQ/YjbR family DNA-binding protein [Gammaproteobacteria bacterium]HIL97825.1 MmcQ/YjbR family DNA-binding protein [Pseudomonadales bacterium]